MISVSKAWCKKVFTEILKIFGKEEVMKVNTSREQDDNIIMEYLKKVFAGTAFYEEDAEAARHYFWELQKSLNKF